ncbi:hypothetical protein J2Z44_002403 [Clostridium punense]|uniref:Pyruvate kinase n=1 Tax=Clostridium punense TaxID=1054297 RepID=A0ABS4K469_9CLOT|nr:MULTISPECIES: DUF3006 domain-containing protein [Clostridium]EQB86215.1 hypothetical protein M918_14855 [Clostridium sp. BL8]MBP2022580.1 hypothetical protein [Clostridium punense]
MKFIIDRFEGSFAVCEDEEGSMHNIEKNLIIGNPKEGDIIEKQGDIYNINPEETEKRKKEVEELMKDMWS